MAPPPCGSRGCSLGLRDTRRVDVTRVASPTHISLSPWTRSLQGLWPCLSFLSNRVSGSDVLFSFPALYRRTRGPRSPLFLSHIQETTHLQAYISVRKRIDTKVEMLFSQALLAIASTSALALPYGFPSFSVPQVHFEVLRMRKSTEINPRAVTDTTCIDARVYVAPRHTSSCFT